MKISKRFLVLSALTILCFAFCACQVSSDILKIGMTLSEVREIVSESDIAGLRHTCMVNGKDSCIVFEFDNTTKKITRIETYDKKEVTDADFANIKKGDTLFDVVRNVGFTLGSFTSGMISYDFDTDDGIRYRIYFDTEDKVTSVITLEELNEISETVPLKYIDVTDSAGLFEYRIRDFNPEGLNPTYLFMSIYSERCALSTYIDNEDLDKYTYKIDDHNRLVIFKYDNDKYYYEIYSDLPILSDELHQPPLSSGISDYIYVIDGEIVVSESELLIPYDFNLYRNWFSATEGYYVSDSLNSNDFAEIKIGDSIEKVAAIDPFVKTDIKKYCGMNFAIKNIDGTSNNEPHVRICYSYRLLEDGIVKISFVKNEDSGNNYDTDDNYTVYSIDFYPYGKADISDECVLRILNSDNPFPLPKN